MWDPGESYALDEHLILRHGAPILPAAAVSPAATAKQKIEACRDSPHQPGELTNRRNHSLMNHLGGLLHSIQSSREQFISVNELQSVSVERIFRFLAHT